MDKYKLASKLNIFFGFVLIFISAYFAVIVIPRSIGLWYSGNELVSTFYGYIFVLFVLCIGLLNLYVGKKLSKAHNKTQLVYSFATSLVSLILMVFLFKPVMFGVLYLSREFQSAKNRDLIRDFVAAGCTVYSDGCNTCYAGGSCTEKSCSFYDTARCLKYTE